MTSLSLMALTPEWMTLTRTSSLVSFQRGSNGLGRTLHVGLDDGVEVLDLALLDLGKEAVQGDLLGHAECLGLPFALPPAQAALVSTVR